MSETIHVDCQRCGDSIAFEVEEWAQPPERAFCDETCYEEHKAQAPQEATVASA